MTDRRSENRGDRKTRRRRRHRGHRPLEAELGSQRLPMSLDQWSHMGIKAGDRSQYEQDDYEEDDYDEEEEEQEERAELTPRERAYKEAKAAANRRIGFLSHLIPYVVVNLFLLLVAGPRAAFWTAIPWGVGLSLHYFFAIVAPDLRTRWVDREVDQRVGVDVSRQRVALEGQQAKRIEELSASIAHEIRNPITAAKSLVQQMGEDPAATDNVEYANVALEELERVERSISHLLRFARDEDIQISEVHMADVVLSALETFRDRLHDIGVTVQQDVQEAGAMKGDPEKLRRVIINLVGNALDAFREAETPDPTLHIQAGENLAGSEVWVRLRDNGPGMEPERLTKIFSPFYTSKQTGTGLGLAITKKVVDAHGGSIEAHSDPGQGTEFVLTFPKDTQDAEESQ